MVPLAQSTLPERESDLAALDEALTRARGQRAALLSGAAGLAAGAFGVSHESAPQPEQPLKATPGGAGQSLSTAKAVTRTARPARKRRPG